MDYDFRLEMKVRDYECDIQGIVNNSVYMNYLEHTRHEFLLSKKVDFADLAAKGINLVVTKAELNFKSSLISGDLFFVTLKFNPVSKIRFEFEQNIYRSKDEQLALSATITGASISDTGRPIKVPEIIEQISV